MKYSLPLIISLRDNLLDLIKGTKASGCNVNILSTHWVIEKKDGSERIFQNLEYVTNSYSFDQQLILDFFQKNYWI